ncbi:putative Gonadotropin-releasing hormone receptor [Hypsibius exemplaris]|uniref:Gonadotropin-releasing hormone receptor n=1 Tax=Hypsibius exemplaris TaxID=2072580 RepID=A0A9X6NEM8_HYPEX|nr:putative Gonadotropin-releasing hormone receptor [Hypsibius exemplaris]
MTGHSEGPLQGNTTTDPEDPNCRSNYTIILMFIDQTNPGYFHHRLNDIILLFSMATLGIVLNLCMGRALAEKSAYRQSANAMLIFNLAIADSLVALFCLMSDGIWNVTMQWVAGDVVCKIVKFMQMFSLYATTLILTGMTVERCITVTFPISKSSRSESLRRARLIVGFAWLFAFVCSIPQAVIFHVERAPICPDFFQCVTHNFYTSAAQELAYTMTTLVLMFILPFVIICFCYITIFASFSKEAQQALGQVRESSLRSVDQCSSPPTVHTERIKPGKRLYQKARRISLWMTFTIALTFVICWTPYYVAMLAFLLQWEIPPETISSIFCFGMSNSVLNPIIVGAFRLTTGNGFKKQTKVIASTASRGGTPVDPRETAPKNSRLRMKYEGPNESFDL